MKTNLKDIRKLVRLIAGSSDCSCTAEREDDPEEWDGLSCKQIEPAIDWSYWCPGCLIRQLEREIKKI